MTRALTTSLAMVLAGCLTVIAPAATASTAQTVTGRATCINKQAPVGIWVDAQSSKDGWATMTGPNPSTGWARVKYSFKLDKGGSYRLHVGCGGSPQSWGLTATSGSISGSPSKVVTCNDVPDWLMIIWRALGPAGLAKLDLTRGIAYKTCGLK